MSRIAQLEEAIRAEWTKDGVEIESPSTSSNKLRCRLPALVQDVQDLVIFANQHGAIMDLETTCIDNEASVVLWMYVDESSFIADGHVGRPHKAQNACQILYDGAFLFAYALAFVISFSHCVLYVFPTFNAVAMQTIHNMTAP